MAWRVHWDISERFAELRELCTAAGDKMSLAIGMVGLVPEHYIHGRVREASQVASELTALVESIGDPTLTSVLSPRADQQVRYWRDARSAALYAESHRLGPR